jgi:type IV pilus assembly PilN-like protein
MSGTIGLELGPEVIRAVRLDRWGRSCSGTFEQHWDPAQPAVAFAALRESLGKVKRLAVTIDLSFLFAKQVRLPPLSAEEKRRILTLEPERFFPVRAEDLVVSVRGEDNLVFAVRASELGPWLSELETIAPVELVEAAPVSIARALRVSDPGKGTIVMEEKHNGVGIAKIEGGRVRGIRRMGEDSEELAATVASPGESVGAVYLRPLNGNQGWRPLGAATVRDLPSVAGAAPHHLAAYGAALGLGGDLGEAMLPNDLSQRIFRRRRRSVVLGALVAALGLGFALFSLDDFRSRTLRKLEAEIVQVRRRAEGPLALEREADAVNREARAVAAIEAGRFDLVGGIAALTHRLPGGAHLESLRATGRDWQIDGYARESAALVAQLEADPRFENVRFLTATSRTQVDGKSYESFSIALRLVPAP